MPSFEHDNILFHYTATGRGIPFIFQHGLGGSADQVLKIYSPPAGVRLITFDFRGHGKTSPGEENGLRFNTFADDIFALMDHLKLPKAIIGGISMGAGVSLNFTLRYPARVAALVLSRPAWLDGPMEQQNLNLFNFVVKLIRENGPETGRQLFMDSPVYAELINSSPGTARSFVGYFDDERASETVAKLQCLPEDAPSDDREAWGKIAVPTLILANKSDPVHPFAYGLAYASAIAGADFKELTPKSVNEEQHNMEVQRNIDLFISTLK